MMKRIEHFKKLIAEEDNAAAYIAARAMAVGFGMGHTIGGQSMSVREAGEMIGQRTAHWLYHEDIDEAVEMAMYRAGD